MRRPTQICIVRHGETDWNTAGILQGWLDVPLNAHGREQARELAERFRHQGLEGICSSPLARALETAEMIATELNLPAPRIHHGLKERNFGVIQGIPKAELAELNPVLYQQIASRNPACHFEEGESMNEFADRIWVALKNICIECPGARLLAITHGWVLDVLTRHVRGLPRHAPLHVKPRNGECLWLSLSRDTVTALPEGDPC